uniref:G-protein coupled receptors family 1 profile domain-containing protein n=1 Tax=Acrobeloides nanus TaxID=290746 RepID=A0A914CY35_9BILA
MLKYIIIILLLFLTFETTDSRTYHNWAMMTMNLTRTYPVDDPPLDVKLSMFILIGFPPLSILLYIPLIYTILTKREKYHNPFYKLVIAIGLNDYILLLHLIYMGFCLMKGECPISETFNAIQMALAMMGCYGCMLLNLLMAWNRFSAVFFYRNYESVLFTEKMVYVYIVMVYIIAICANIPSFVFGVKFYPAWGTFWFVKQPAIAFIEFWQIFNLVFAYLLHIGLIGLYLTAFIKCYKMSKESTTDHLKLNRRFLYMAAITGIPCLAYVNCYHFGPSLSADFFAMLCMVITPFIYIWFNKELRKDVLCLFGLGKESRTYPSNFVQSGTGKLDASSNSKATNNSNTFLTQGTPGNTSAVQSIA